MVEISQELLKKYNDRGYTKELLPKEPSQKTWGIFNYFTLWMGSVHNVPNYVAVGGFLVLGLSTINVMGAIMVSALIVSLIMVLNGAAGSKYGIPFSMLLRASYGIRGALFPGLLRGGIAAIMWFGLQNYAGSLALLILIGKLWPNFLTIWGPTKILGITIPRLIVFLIFCGANIGIGLAGGNILNKFTAILNPLIYIVFGGMAIWTISLVGFKEIFAYVPKNVQSGGNHLFLFFIIVNAIIAVWSGPMVSVSDFTQNSKSFKAQSVGQTLGLLVSYILFAFSSVCILAGASVHYGVDTWNVLDIVKRWDNIFVSIFAVMVILMTTISTNATGNIIPAGYQLAATFKKLSYKQGVLLASLISIIICPWKLMENQNSIYTFLDIIGGILGPVIGVMLSHYFVVIHQEINLDNLYIEEGNFSYYKNGFNSLAFIATIVAGILSLGGKIITVLEPLSRLSWFVGIIVAFLVYSGLIMIDKKRNPEIYKEIRGEIDLDF